jgi:hypothetical protein
VVARLGRRVEAVRDSTRAGEHGVRRHRPELFVALESGETFVLCSGDGLQIAMVLKVFSPEMGEKMDNFDSKDQMGE